MKPFCKLVDQMNLVKARMGQTDWWIQR